MRCLTLCALLATCSEGDNITYTYTPCETNDDCPGVGGMCTEGGLCAYIPQMNIDVDVPTESDFDLCDGEDEDGDGELDENDPSVGRSCIGVLDGAAVAGTYTCREGSLVCRSNCNGVEACNDGIDNDCNGLVDCADQTCARLESCNPVCIEDRNCNPIACVGAVCMGPPQWCIYGIDEDGDGYSPALAAEGCVLDCDDTDANVFPEGVETCDNGRDDDCDTLADVLDPDCQCSAPAILMDGTVVEAASAPLLTLANDSPSGPIRYDDTVMLRFEIRTTCSVPVRLTGLTIRAIWNDQLAVGWRPVNVYMDIGSGVYDDGMAIAPTPTTENPYPTSVNMFGQDFRVNTDYLLLPNTAYSGTVYATTNDVSPVYEDVLQFSVIDPANWCTVPDAGDETCYETRLNISERAPIGDWLIL